MDNPKFKEAKIHSATMMVVHRVVGLIALITAVVCACILNNNMAGAVVDFVKGLLIGSIVTAYLSLTVSDYEDGYSHGIEYGYVLGKDKTNDKK